MATTTTNFGWDIPQSTDLVKDGATAIAALGQDIDTALVDLKGGTTGQVLAKATNTDLDFTWVAQDDSNAIQNAIVDAKGDLISATAADTPARLAVGTNGQVLTADSSTATGLKWATVGGGGKVLQVVQATISTDTTVTSTSYTDTSLSASITPSATTSKVMVIATQLVTVSTGGQSDIGLNLNIMRGATQVYEIGQNQAFTLYSNSTGTVPVSFSYLDSPSTTSATTYKIQARLNATSGRNARFQQNSSTSNILLLEIGA